MSAGCGRPCSAPSDGIISTASLILGVASASASQSDVLLTGVAGLVAGAMSMAAGEYVSVSSQSDTEHADLARENKELANDPVFEREELAQVYVARGVEAELAREVAKQLMTKDALGVHARDELGISAATDRAPGAGGAGVGRDLFGRGGGAAGVRAGLAIQRPDPGGVGGPEHAAAREAQWLRWRSVADLYHAYFTGLILTVVTRRGTADAAEFVFRVFRRQQQERFLPGLEKLGLSHLPPAVAAAQYHYLSNWIGGVHVEYMYETDRKAWIRYPPPRWIWKGTAICGVPGEVSRAMLRGWHANNGVALGNLNLGFVCTKQSVDGQDGLEGFYCEYDHPLEPDARLDSRAISKRRCSIRPQHPRCRSQAGQSRGSKKPIAITRWNMSAPPHP